MDEARAFLRLENTADDALLADLISAARAQCEHDADCTFVTTSWRWTLDSFPCDGSPIVLPRPPLASLTSLAYFDQGGVSRAVDPSQLVVSAGTPGRISPAFASYFPIAQPRASAVQVAYTAGYGDAADSVPRNVKQAIRMLVAHYYEHRSEDFTIPDAVFNLLNANRYYGYA